MPTYTDRELAKAATAGQLAGQGASDNLSTAGRIHSHVLTWDVGSDATIAEIGIDADVPFIVKSAKFTPTTGLAANGSAYIDMLIQKRDGAGGAAVTVGTISTNSAGANTSLSAFVPTSFTLSATGANLKFAAGNVITFKSTETGTPATPIGKVRVVVEYL